MPPREAVNTNDIELTMLETGVVSNPALVMTKSGKTAPVVPPMLIVQMTLPG